VGQLGLNSADRDWAAWLGKANEADVILRSQFNLFRDVGFFLFRDSRQALDFAMEKIALPDPKPTLQEFADWKAEKHLFEYFEGAIEAPARTSAV
jgi:hypothetical protein